MARPYHAPSRMKAPLGFRLWFGFVLTVILLTWAAIGFGFYRVATDPEGVGHFAGRIIGGAISGAQERR